MADSSQKKRQKTLWETGEIAHYGQFIPFQECF